VAKAAGELAQLQSQITEARGALAKLQTEMVAAQADLGTSRATRLQEANEQLVLATLGAQRAAEISAQALKEALQTAELDSLTELPNRTLLRARLAMAVSSAKEIPDACAALLLMDLADFRKINDTLGHATGDEVLQVVARRLAAAAPAGATVSRHGGNEFLILLPSLAGADEAVELAGKLIAAIGVPLRYGEHVLRLTARVGISMYPADGDSADSLIDRAVAAMYRAKWRGQDSVAFRDGASASVESLELRTLESLRTSLTHREISSAEHERQYGLLRDANTQLVMAALSAQDLQAAAEQAQRRQVEFLGVLAHELRNPLGPISNAAAILGRIPTDGPLLAKVQGIIEKQVNDMARLLGDLLDVTRVTTGKLSLARETVEIVTLLDQVVQSCRPAMDARLQKFDVALPQHAVQLYADPLRLTQIMNNLLGNASKYTPEGGNISLTVSAPPGAGFMTLYVSDDGIGISAQALPRIFDAFVQDQHASVFNGAGLGIGLTVVRELVEAHGGTVEAISAGIGLGAQFRVTLPLTGFPVPAANP